MKNKRWFACNYVLTVRLQNVENQEARGYGKFFDTWKEAHEYAVALWTKKRDGRKKEFVNSERILKKCLAMKPPISDSLAP